MSLSPHSSANLSQLLSLRADCFSRIPQYVYLDAQPVVQWMRWGVFDAVIAMLAGDPLQRGRVRLQHEAFEEAKWALNGMEEGGWSPARTTQRLTASAALCVDRSEEMSPSVSSLVGEIRQRLCETGGGVAAGPDKHIGEAETLAYIANLNPGSLFVTADRDAGRIAGEYSAVHALPLALVAGLVDDASRVEWLWAALCRARSCGGDGPSGPSCRQTSRCPGSPGTRDGLVLSKIGSADDLLEWMLSDLRHLHDGLLRVR